MKWGKIQLLPVIFGFVKHCINEERLEESLFESPGRQVGVQHFQLFLVRPGVPSCAVKQSRCLHDAISTFFLCNKIFSFPNTAKQFIILLYTSHYMCVTPKT